jgi:hypothetical protein
MRILITGVNSVQCGKRPRLDYVSAVVALHQTLLQAGHEVEIRAVVLGESFDGYDRVVVFIASMRGFVCVETLGALWAIHRAGERVTISFDDWQVPQAVQGIKAFAAEREKIITTNPFGYHQIEKFGDYRPNLWSALDTLINEWWWPILVPVYKGGDLSKLKIPGQRLYPYNPSVVFKGKYGWASETETKKKEWVLAALHDHSAWLKKQKVEWPVQKLGHRKSKQERIPESQLYQRYAQSIGVLSPAYKISGSGWWRARYGFAADAFCVISGDPAEMAMVDPQCYPAPVFVETCSPEEVFELASAQRAAYYEAAGTLPELLDDVMASFTGPYGKYGKEHNVFTQKVTSGVT